MDADTKAIFDTVEFIKDNMVTRDEFNEFRDEVHEGFRDIRHDVAELRKQLETLHATVDQMTGYAKDIDHALERIAAIEKHLGLDKKIAA